MNKIIALLLFALALPATAAPRHADGDYVVILNGNESPQRVKQAHRVGARPGRDHQWTANNGFHGFSAHLNGQQADNLEADTRVAVIEPDVIAHAIGFNSQNYATNASLLSAISPGTSVRAVLTTDSTGVGITFSDGVHLSRVILPPATQIGNVSGVAISGTSVATIGFWTNIIVSRFSANAALPTALSLVTTNTFGTSDSRAGLIHYGASGLFYWYYQFTPVLDPMTGKYPLACTVGYLPNGTSTWKTHAVSVVPMTTGNNLTAIAGQGICRHPADGAMWMFFHRDSHDELDAIRCVEQIGDISVSALPALINTPTNMINSIQAENPKLEAFPDPVGGKIILVYPNTQQQIFSLAPFYKGAYMTVARLNTSGIPTFDRLPVYCERNSFIGSMIDQFGRVSLLYQTVDQNGISPIGYLATLDQSRAWNTQVVATNVSYLFGTGNASPGILALNFTTKTNFIITSITDYQVIPTGVSRIGCLSNALWQASSATPIPTHVAVIDTGIQLTHPDLNVYTNVTFVSGTTTGNDDNGHGTHVAGIVGARNNNIGVVGVAPGAPLEAVKVLDSTGAGALSTIISGVDWVAQNSSRIAVANMSLGGQGQSDSLRLAIQAAVARGIVFVVAAGNDHFEIYGGDKVFGTSDDFFPASYPEVMAVSAVCDTDGLQGGAGPGNTYGKDDSLASFSSYSLSAIGTNVFSPGAAIDLAAPGVDIYSTWIGSTYTNLSGTSMASPHAAGAVALYIAGASKPTNAAGVYAIRQALIDTAEPQSEWGVNPTDPLGALFDFNPEGLLNVSSFVPSGTKPILAVTAPIDQYVTGVTNLVNFTGTASDVEDGDIGNQIVWTDSVIGRIGAGTNFFSALATAGVHVISARVSDSDGNVVNKAISVTVTNAVALTAPNLVITCPTNNADIPSGSFPAFTASALDKQDGDITASIYWSYPAWGNLYQLGTGSPMVFAFGNQGNYTVYANVTNSVGLSAMAQVSFYVDGGVTNAPPSITIQQPLSGQAFLYHTALTMAGSAQDALDGNLSSAITWASSVDGALGTGATLTRTNLTVGAHTIKASVVDNGTGPGTPVLTNSASVAITIYTNTVTATNLIVTGMSDKTSYHRKEKARITANVKANSANVAGATVNIQVLWSKAGKATTSYATGTSDSLGNFTWLFPVSPQNNGTNTVTINASKTGYVPGNTNFTFTVIP